MFFLELSEKGRTEKSLIVNLHAIPFIRLAVNFASMTFYSYAVKHATSGKLFLFF